MLQLKTKLKYAILFALTFAILTGISFLAGLFASIQMAPPPVAEAMVDYTGFVPVMMIGAFILNLLQTFLLLWLYSAHKKWCWPVTLILALFLGGLASFFSFWLIWVLVTLANLLLSFVLFRFAELKNLKA